MSKKFYSLFAVLLVAMFVLAACGGSAANNDMANNDMANNNMANNTADDTADAAPAFKACQVTDTGGIDDKSFNATAYAGMEQAEADFGIEPAYLESQQQTDYETNINAFIEEGCDLIITVGFLLGDATAAAAEANPDQTFGIIDFAYDPAFENVAGHVFATDQAAFLAGYIAASQTKTGKVATFGGLAIPPVTVFMDGFWYGVQYYNNQMGAGVEVLGWDPATQTGSFTNNFESTDDGRAFAESFMDEGADIIMPVAGPVGLGSAAAVQERGDAWIVGVDSDWTATSPQYADVILTSVLKNMNATVYAQIETMLAGESAGSLIVGTLENGGVGIAGDWDVAELITGINAGEIQTSP